VLASFSHLQAGVATVSLAVIAVCEAVRTFLGARR
jgi:hypothetical protein